MHKYLRHDTGTNELRLVYTDFWQGQHEHTEYRLTDTRGGGIVHGYQALDGKTVLGTVPGLYFTGPLGGHVQVWTEETSVMPTVKTPCPKASNTRRKCTLCAELAS